ncbi:PIN domain-containing protein [Neomegalonema sp.]|uniref:PIN domain-containing protein n=1 Tax=Neomegalonema sp. TaxID=2039713 RepID=UPI00345BCA6F
MLPVETAGFAAAARFSDQYALGLRAGEALHLAIAAETGATLVSLDKRLVEFA